MCVGDNEVASRAGANYTPEASICCSCCGACVLYVNLTKQQKQAARQCRAVGWHDPQAKQYRAPVPRGASHLPPSSASCASHVFQCHAQDERWLGKKWKQRRGG